METTKVMRTSISPGVRIGSMILDHVIMSFCCGIICIPVLLISIFHTINNTHNYQDFIFIGSFIYAILIGFTMYFLKDSFDGRSFGKRITGLQVVNYKTDIVATPLRCLIRNLFIVIWPIEFVVTLINPDRRIGDYVAGTKVVLYNKNDTPIKINYAQIVSLFICVLLLLFVIMRPINNFLLKLDKNKSAYVPSSFNQQKSNEIMQIISDSIGHGIVSDIKVYDKMQNSNFKYISGVVKIDINMKTYKFEFDSIDDKLIKIIHTQFPIDSITGQIKFICSNGIVLTKIK